MLLQNDYIGRSIFIGSRDELSLAFLESFLHDHSTIADIGANIGYNTLFFVKQCQGKVYAFEPSLKEFELLKRNVQMNNSEGYCVLEQLIVSNSLSEKTLHLSDINSGTNTLFPTANNRYSTSILVRSTTIDSYARQRNVRFDFLKIDVEGAELEVLEGAINTLRNDKPHIFIELWGCHNKTYKADVDPVTRFLTNESYSLFTIGDNQSLKEVQENDFIEAVDFLAVHKSKISNITRHLE